MLRLLIPFRSAPAGVHTHMSPKRGLDASLQMSYVRLIWSNLYRVSML